MHLFSSIPTEALSGELLWVIAAFLVGFILWAASGWILRPAVGAIGLGLGALGGLLIFVNTMVILIAIGTFLYLFLHNDDAGAAAGAKPQAAPASADPAYRTASSSVGSTTANPILASTATPSDGKQLKPTKGGDGSKAKLSKRALDIYAATNPATQGTGDDSDQKPTAQL